MARSSLPRWFWPLLALLCALFLLLQMLLRHSSDEDAGTGEAGAGAGARGRAPFPKGGDFSEVRRKPEVAPREKSAVDPWQDGREQK